MASGIFIVLKKATALFDDVALATKVATEKTASILGDDLAVNAEKSTGFDSSRELPVLWAITKGSFLNKLILVPAILVLNVYFPTVIKYALIAGGVYFAFEATEKILEYIKSRKEKASELGSGDGQNIETEGTLLEKSKIKDAIFTDFILSLEIVIIALSTVLESPLNVQIITVSLVALIATVGVYGLVALIVRMDDAGFFLIQKSGSKGLLNALGRFLISALPVVIPILTVIGTVALLTVAGGIFLHYTDYFHHYLEGIPDLLRELTLGLLVGIVVVGIIESGKFLWKLTFGK